MSFLRPQPQIDLEHNEGEQILWITKRHWIILLQRGFIPFLLAAGAAALAIYRASGGVFFEQDIRAEGNLDVFNWILLIIIVSLFAFWLAPRKGVRRSFLRFLTYGLVIGVLVLLFVFRFMGGAVLYIDPAEAGNGGLANLLLTLMALINAAIFVYVLIDWANDSLVLTNTRVIYDDVQFLVRHVQQQILIEDIQQVNMRADSYPEYWFNYGTLVLRSFSPRRLTFDHAANPQAMRERIQAEINRVRGQQKPEAIRQLIEDQVYGNKPPPKPALPIQVHESRGPLPWLFKPNPQINYATETIIWRPFWLYTLASLLQPVGLFVLSVIGIALINRLFDLSLGSSLLIWLPIGLFSAGWAFWIFEEQQNDSYILTRRDITDVDQKPLGPVNRRSASLGAIQDIIFDVGFIENIFGFGDVRVLTGGAGGGDFTFRRVPNPRGVQATINDYLTDFRKHEEERQLQNSVALLRQYHQVQEAHGEVFDREELAREISDRLKQELPVLKKEEIDQQVAEAIAKRLRREVHQAARVELVRLLRRRARRRAP